MTSRDDHLSPDEGAAAHAAAEANAAEQRSAADSNAAAEALHALDQGDASTATNTSDAPDAVGDRPNQFTDVAAELGLAIAPVQPPASLRADLMALIAVTPQLPAEAPTLAMPAEASTLATRAVEAPEVPEVAAAPATSAIPTNAEQRAAARWRKPVAVLLAVAAASALFFGGIAIGQLENAQAPDTRTQAGQLAAIAAAPDSQRAVAEVAGGGTATLVWSGELGSSAILVNGLTPLTDEQTYQLWYIGADGPVSAGTFEPSSNGTTWHVLDGKMSAGDTVGVTVEPRGGSEAPTSDPIVAIES